jgi:peroxin-1
VSSKVTLSPDVDLEEFAQATGGFSGADLQALVYNAHLRVVHDTISATRMQENGTETFEDDEKPIQYVILGGKTNEKKVVSRAEEAAFQKEVCIHSKRLT